MHTFKEPKNFGTRQTLVIMLKSLTVNANAHLRHYSTGAAIC